MSTVFVHFMHRGTNIVYQPQFVLCIVMCKVRTWTIYTALYFTLSVSEGWPLL